MRSRWLALAGAVLTLALMPREGQAQSATGDLAKKRQGEIKSVYPNPSNPESRAPFTVDSTCSDPRKQYRVSLTVINAIGQTVHVAQLEGSGGGVAGGQKLQNVLMTCGQYVGYWNGKILDTQREAASGVYTWILTMDGKVAHTIRALVVK